MSSRNEWTLLGCAITLFVLVIGRDDADVAIGCAVTALGLLPMAMAMEHQEPNTRWEQAF